MAKKDKLVTRAIRIAEQAQHERDSLMLALREGGLDLRPYYDDDEHTMCWYFRWHEQPPVYGFASPEAAIIAALKTR